MALEQTKADGDLPNIEKARLTALSAWSVISSVLFDIGSSDSVSSIVGLAGLEVNWTLSKEEAFSHKTRIRAYRPRIEAAYQKLDLQDRVSVLSIIAAKLVRSYPQKLDVIHGALAKIGWTLKTASEPGDPPQTETSIMKRHKKLQKLLLTQVRDGEQPPELSNYPPADQAYNAALLINEGLVEGHAL